MFQPITNLDIIPLMICYRKYLSHKAKLHSFKSFSQEGLYPSSHCQFGTACNSLGVSLKSMVFIRLSYELVSGEMPSWLIEVGGPSPLWVVPFPGQGPLGSARKLAEHKPPKPEGGAPPRFPLQEPELLPSLSSRMGCDLEV